MRQYDFPDEFDASHGQHQHYLTEIGYQETSTALATDRCESVLDKSLTWTNSVLSAAMRQYLHAEFKPVRSPRSKPNRRTRLREIKS
jgi:hypothetical protein